MLLKLKAFAIAGALVIGGISIASPDAEYTSYASNLISDANTVITTSISDGENCIGYWSSGDVAKSALETANEQLKEQFERISKGESLYGN